MANEDISNRQTDRQRRDELDQATLYWKPLKSSLLSDDDLQDMSGYGIAARITKETEKEIFIFVEDDPYVIPADTTEKFRVYGNFTQRHLWESKYAQSKIFDEPYIVFGSSGCANILSDDYGNSACLVRYRNSPAATYFGRWNLTLGAASFCPGFERFAEHFGEISLAKRRTLNDFAILRRFNNKFDKLILPNQFVNFKPEEKEKKLQSLVETISDKIRQSRYVNKYAPIPDSAMIVESGFLNLQREKTLVITHRDKVYTKRRGIAVQGDQDYCLVRTLEYHLGKIFLDDIIAYDLQANAKTGLVLNNFMGLFRLNCNQRPEFIDGKPNLIKAFQSGRVADMDATPLSREVVPSLKKVFY